MSDTTSDTGTTAADRVSLDKRAGSTSADAGTTGRGRGARAPKAPPVEAIRPPWTVDIVTGALVVIAICGVITAALFRLPSYVNQLTAFEGELNAKAKNPVQGFDTLHAVQVLRSSALIQAGIVGLAVLLLAWAMRRTRSASGSRWALLIIVVFTGIYNTIVPTKGLPVPLQVVGVLSGASAIIALVLVFVAKPSQQYFRACKTASTPPELRGQPRPGLASLFGPKRPKPGAAAPARGSRPATTRPADRSAATRGAPKAKAKVRADTDAVARGAELARSRAKASKSRRTGD